MLLKERKTNVNLIILKFAEQEENRETKLVERYLIYWLLDFVISVSDYVRRILDILYKYNIRMWTNRNST